MTERNKIISINIADIDGGIWSVRNYKKIASISHVNLEGFRSERLTGNLSFMHFDGDAIGLITEDNLPTFDIEVEHMSCVFKVCGVRVPKAAMDITEGHSFEFTAEKVIPWSPIVRSGSSDGRASD